MKKLNPVLVGAAAVVLSASAFAGGPPAGAGDKGKPEGVACQHAGIATLQALGLLAAVAKSGIEVAGVGVLNFSTVLELHRTMPELFRTGGVSVIVDGQPVPATWCD